MLTISFPTTPPLGFVFHDRMITTDYGLNISGFFWVTSVLYCLSSTDLSQHWCYLRKFCMSFFCLFVFFFALPHAALFMFSFYPAIHHSSVPWFKLWATLTELVHWSELGQVWNMNWVHVWVWLRVWCFSLLHVLPSFDLVYFLFPAYRVLLDHRYFLQFLYCGYSWVLYPAFFSSISFKPSVLTSSFLITFSPHHFHLRHSQSQMNCWHGILATRRPSAQWLPSSHADANFTVQLGCVSLCHHPGGRVLGMPGRVTPPACASSAVSLVGSIWKHIKTKDSVKFGFFRATKINWLTVNSKMNHHGSGPTRHLRLLYGDIFHHFLTADQTTNWFNQKNNQDFKLNFLDLAIPENVL